MKLRFLFEWSLVKLNASTLFFKVMNRKIEYFHTHCELNSQKQFAILDWLFTKINDGKVSAHKNFCTQKHLTI